MIIAEERGMTMRTEPKVTKEQLVSWCPEPRGNQPVGYHHEIPALEFENAASRDKDAENRLLNQKLLATFREFKKDDRFILQWRMFPNASHPAVKNPDGCGCGCSCGCS